MKRSVDRILTTHTGSLFRPPDLLDMINAHERGEAIDQAIFGDRLRKAVNDVVTRQAACGIDIVDDGEQSKPNFVEFVADRLNGLEGHNPTSVFANRVLDFPEFYADQAGPRVGDAWRSPMCIGPLSWKDKSALETDIANLQTAMMTVDVEQGFMPSPSPGIIAMRIPSSYYANEEEYLFALARVMREEYEAITEAGLILQIDAPDIPLIWGLQFGAERLEEYRSSVAMRVEALNYALENIPEESVRCHICWGNGEAPHTLDIDLEKIVDLVLKINAQGYSIEAANPRHAHEWELWRDVKLPENKILITGVVDSTTNFVEHPKLIAQRIVQYASLVGRENVIAGSDCGFGTTARTKPRVHPSVVWGKFQAIADGAAIATEQLWG